MSEYTLNERVANSRVGIWHACRRAGVNCPGSIRRLAAFKPGLGIVAKAVREIGVLGAQLKASLQADDKIVL